MKEIGAGLIGALAMWSLTLFTPVGQQWVLPFMPKAELNFAILEDPTYVGVETQKLVLVLVNMGKRSSEDVRIKFSSGEWVLKRNIQIHSRVDYDLDLFKGKCPLISPEQMCKPGEEIEFVRTIRIPHLLSEQGFVLEYVGDILPRFFGEDKSFDIFDSVYIARHVELKDGAYDDLIDNAKAQFPEALSATAGI